MKKGEHAIFLDGECPFCIRTALKVISWDTERKFKFSPLQSSQAKKLLSGPYPQFSQLKTLILVENYRDKKHSRIWTRGRALFRIFWLLGGKWKSLGWLCYVPIGLNWGYDLVAAMRHHIPLKKKLSFAAIPKDRLL
jgi:predicted DCC family thiol-disulfide oxidoreductase YuxK